MNKIIAASMAFTLSLSVCAARPVRGTYEVPVTGDIQPHSTFQVKFKADNYDRNPVSIEFPLPLELTGNQEYIHLSQSTPNSTIWNGPKVDATCAKEGRWFVCQMKFHDLPIDLARSQEVIANRYTDPAQAEGILEVVKRFSGEGIGVLRYKLRGRED